MCFCFGCVQVPSLRHDRIDNAYDPGEDGPGYGMDALFQLYDTLGGAELCKQVCVRVQGLARMHTCYATCHMYYM